jgi:uncharacterized integral membrane protein (TIGR00697 family)
MSLINKSLKPTKYYDIILAIFVSFLLISNISAVKVIDINGFLTDGGAILFPLTYIFGDILTEVYGYRYTRRAIWTAFSVMAIASLTFLIVGWLPSSADWPNQSSWNAILGFVPRIVIASLIAFLVGQFVNAFILAKLKAKFGKEKLWIRLVGSTVVGELLDTTIFAVVAFAGTGFMSGSDMIKYILIGWAFKTIVEVLFLPLSYLIINKLKNAEHKDALDTKTNFNPFRLDV